MQSQLFYLLGESQASVRTLRFDEDIDVDGLRELVASHFAIVVASGIWLLMGNIQVTILSHPQ